MVTHMNPVLLWGSAIGFQFIAVLVPTSVVRRGHGVGFLALCGSWFFMYFRPVALYGPCLLVRALLVDVLELVFQMLLSVFCFDCVTALAAIFPVLPYIGRLALWRPKCWFRCFAEGYIYVSAFHVLDAILFWLLKGLAR